MRRTKALNVLGFAASAALVATLAAPADVSAQAGAFVAPTDALDTLNSGSVGSAGNAVDRARGVADAIAADPFAAPAAPAGGDPFAAPAGGDPFGAPAGGGDPFGAPAGGGDPFGGAGEALGGAIEGVTAAVNTIATLKAYGGIRFVCRRTGVVLEDAREVNILATEVSSYFDDGENGLDAVKGDNIYTNITLDDNYISPESHVVKTKIIRTLMYTSGLFPENYANGMDPRRFNRVRVASTEPTSPFPKLVGSDQASLNDADRPLENEQDKIIGQWALTFLADYRENKDLIDSGFYKTYLPLPPRAPRIPLPLNFTPQIIPVVPGAPGAAAGQPGAGEAAGGDPLGGGVTGEPVGNASSRYF